MSDRVFRGGVAACAAAAAAFFALRLTAWPPHEDEVLALYVGQGTVGELLETVIGERGGAPLHFLFAWLVAHLGGGLGALRAVSAVAAVAAIPAIATLALRLCSRAEALFATVLVSASWMLLFHGVYARMYALFLLASTLSYLALLAALGRGGRSWALWVVATLLCVAAHPYGALVAASQAVFVLLARERLREATIGFFALGVLGTPFWISDLVLAGRFDVGLGGGGDRLGAPLPVLEYLARTAGDFTIGWTAALPFVLLLAAIGAVLLARVHRRGALLVAAVIGTPSAAFLLARLGAGASPESRHLIFVLPFFGVLTAVALAAAARRVRAPVAVVAAAAVAVVGAEIAWAWTKTPPLFTGDAQARADARQAAGRWLAASGRSDDVLLGFEPVFLEAWQRSNTFSRLVLPRADAKLAATELERTQPPLGRGVWVFDAYDTNNVDQELQIERRLPRPAGAYEARTFGPYLIVRTRAATVTPAEYLRRAAAALLVGRTLAIGDADVNFATVDRAAERLGYSDDRSRSSASR